MKNQPNKTTVKDGLPTAEQIIREKIKEHSASTVNIDVDNIPAFTHFLFVAIDAMQEYSDQQNAELRERVKELEATRKSECIAFANWLSNQVLRGRSIEKLWRDYEMEVLK